MKKIRQLNVNIKIDYEKLMKSKQVKIIPEAYCSNEEKGVIGKIADKLITEIKGVKSVDFVIEEEEIKKRYKSFERCNKMGAMSSFGYIPR